MNRSIFELVLMEIVRKRSLHVLVLLLCCKGWEIVAEATVTDDGNRNNLDLCLRCFDILYLPKSTQQEPVKNIFYLTSKALISTTVKILLCMPFGNTTWVLRNRNPSVKGIAMAVPMAHYSSIVLKYTCVFMYPRSVMIDVPSKASGLWGWQIWPLQRWVDQQLCYDWLLAWRNTLDASCDLVQLGKHKATLCTQIWVVHVCGSCTPLPKCIPNI